MGKSITLRRLTDQNTAPFPQKNGEVREEM
jgi:hypothetical protein